MAMGMIIYSGLVLFIFFFFMFVIGEKYFLGIAGMMKRIVRFGMLVICVSLSLFLLFPFLFFSKDFNDIYSALKISKERALEKLQTADDVSLQTIIKEVRNFRKLPLFFSGVKASLSLIVVGGTIQVFIIAIVITCIIISRDPIAKREETYTRKHIFEYKNILNVLNKGE